MEGRSLVRFQPRTRHSGRLHARQHERTDEICARLTDDGLGAIEDDDAAPLHRLLEMQGRTGLADDVANGGGEGEGLNVIEERNDHLVAVGVAPDIELQLEEGPRDRIADATDNALA